MEIINSNGTKEKIHNTAEKARKIQLALKYLFYIAAFWAASFSASSLSKTFNAEQASNQLSFFGKIGYYQDYYFNTPETLAQIVITSILLVCICVSLYKKRDEEPQWYYFVGACALFILQYCILGPKVWDCFLAVGLFVLYNKFYDNLDNDNKYNNCYRMLIALFAQCLVSYFLFPVIFIFIRLSSTALILIFIFFAVVTAIISFINGALGQTFYADAEMTTPLYKIGWNGQRYDLTNRKLTAIQKERLAKKNARRESTIHIIRNAYKRSMETVFGIVSIISTATFYWLVLSSSVAKQRETIMAAYTGAGEAKYPKFAALAKEMFFNGWPYKLILFIFAVSALLFFLCFFLFSNKFIITGFFFGLAMFAIGIAGGAIANFFSKDGQSSLNIKNPFLLKLAMTLNLKLIAEAFLSSALLALWFMLLTMMITPFFWNTAIMLGRSALYACFVLPTALAFIPKDLKNDFIFTVVLIIVSTVLFYIWHFISGIKPYSEFTLDSSD